MKQTQSLDVAGVKPLADSVKIATKGAIDGAAAFLGRICLPAAEEFGLMLRDKVMAWRARNLVNVTRKAEALLEREGTTEGAKAHPRVINEILSHAAWSDDEGLQSMWAGLLASSCSPERPDDSNLVFVHILNQLDAAQARFIDHVCTKAKKRRSEDDLIYADKVVVQHWELESIWATKDVERIDRELDHLNALGLINGALPIHTDKDVERIRKRNREVPRNKDGSVNRFFFLQLRADVVPTSLSLHLYARCQGWKESALKWYNLQDRVE